MLTQLYPLENQVLDTMYLYNESFGSQCLQNVF